MKGRTINELLDKIKNEILFKDRDNLNEKYILNCIKGIRSILKEMQSSIDKMNEELDKCDV